MPGSTPAGAANCVQLAVDRDADLAVDRAVAPTSRSACRCYVSPTIVAVRKEARGAR